MTNHLPEPDRPWLRRWIYLSHALLILAAIILGVVWMILPENAEGMSVVRVAFYLVVGTIATSLSVNDELRYRIWREKMRPWPRQ